MSRWDHFGWYTRTPKKPPPEHGVKVKKAGSTWWGQRWIEALQDVLRGDSARLARGRSYARAGRTHDLVAKAGKVAAKVTGSRATPYDVTIALAQLGEPTWQKAIAGMAAKAQFSAELLAGRMPHEIDEVFRAAGTSLFPTRRADLTTSCSCPDWGDPCKHVAATHYVLGEALDRDPFLLFELRGKSKDQVLDALRAARVGSVEPASSPRSKKSAAKTVNRDANPPEIASVVLGKVKASNYDRPREALPSLHFSFDEPATHGAVLRQLGAPATWGGKASPAELLAPLVRAAAETARRLAMAEACEAGDDRVDAQPLVPAGRQAPRGSVAATAPRRDRRSSPSARSGRSDRSPSA
ncbi:MAG: SWIM zinc finger family protein [Thermodesulfobacteriota bacterium]